MPVNDGTEPVADDEVLYRRIPVSMGWYSSAGLSPEAFDPRKDEISGLSVYRAKYKTLEEVARGKSKQGYFVAVLRAGDLRRLGIDVEPKPELDDPGHAELPGLTCLNRLDPTSQEQKVLLAKSSQEVCDPFVPCP